MSEAKLNFNPDTLDHSSALYDLYSRLYQGMHDANEVDAPDFTSNPPYLKNSDGSVKKDDLGVPQVDHGAIATQLSEFSDILMKNSAYLFANALPADELPVLDAGALPPDVSDSDPYAQQIRLLYQARVLQGNDASGAFQGDQPITRAQATAILTRLALPGQRTA